MAIVSVILPSLNVKHYIEQCLLSVQNQSFTDIEIICVDAGSTDGTLEIIEKFSHIDSRIKIINSSVKSYGYQVNRGIEASTGKYIAIVETDDYINYDMYEVLVNHAEKNNLDYVKGEFSGLYYVNNEEFLKQDTHTMKEMYGLVINVNQFPNIILKDYSIWRGIYRKSFLFDNNIWLNESAGAAFQDIGFVTETILKAQRIMYVESPFYQYRLNRPGCSTLNLNILKYVKQEWQRLIEDRFSIKSIRNINEMILRMQNSIISEVNKLLEMLDYNYTDEHIANYLTWFQDTLRICEQEYGCDLTESIHKMIDSFPDYVQDYKREREICKRNEDEIISNARKHDKVSVFGAGTYGFQTIKLLRENDIKITNVYDNAKFGNSFLGFNVINPEEIKKSNEKELIVIANKNHYREIERELKEFGISEEDICIYHIF